MGKTFKEQFVEALENGITHKAIYLAQFMKNEINEFYDYRSPLVWAKRYGNEKVVKALSDMGAVEEVDKEGMIDELLKILDADKIDEKRAIELIKDGANIEKKDKFGDTALMRASWYGCLDVVKTLISRGAKVDEKNKWKKTALIKASENGHVEVVEALIDAGAEVDEKDKDGFTALITASWYVRLDVVKTLISRGAKVDEKDNDGNTALIKVPKDGNVEIVKALLDAGADVTMTDDDGNTALIEASQRGNVEIVKALLDAGADVTITNNKGYTAIDCTSDDEIKKLLNDALRKQKEKKSEQTVKYRRGNSLGE